MHEHAFLLFHVCEVAKMILYTVTSRKLKSDATSTSCAPYNVAQTFPQKRIHGKLRQFPWLSKSLSNVPKSFKLATGRCN